MPPTNDPRVAPVDPEMEACLSRTRASVLNLLVGVGLMIAVSGWLLRRHAEHGVIKPARGWHDGLLFGLIGVAVCSYLVRRRRPRGSDAEGGSRRLTRFFWTLVGSAAIAAVGVPLGLVYGWFVDPRLEGVIVFWVVPLALGFLALPRRGELDDLRPSSPSPEAPST
jgi:peptidoglycan/LPS O-acetylase OafA/YrhL